jgi:hypothetical protein
MSTQKMQRVLVDSPLSIPRFSFWSIYLHMHIEDHECLGTIKADFIGSNPRTKLGGVMTTGLMSLQR